MLKQLKINKEPLYMVPEAHGKKGNDAQNKFEIN